MVANSHPVRDSSKEVDGLRGVGRYLDAPSPYTIKPFPLSHIHAYMYTQKHVNIPAKIGSVGAGLQRVGTKVDTGE